MTDSEIEAIRARYIGTLAPLFFPDDPISNDIINYFSSLLRIVGMEDGGWDPHLESRALLEDLNSIFMLELPAESFPDPGLTTWRLGLLFYSHIVEMDAPYEVLANLLRFRLGKGYSPNPFFIFLTEKEQKKKGSKRLSPSRKIEILKRLGDDAGVQVSALLNEFYDSDLRNAIAHSDFIITEDSFRSRGGSGGVRPLSVPLERLNEIITKAKVFIGTFLGLDVEARRFWGERKGQGIPYDARYKGLMEVLVDDKDLMVGFNVHWPNNSESLYRRTPQKVEMTNCMLNLRAATLDLNVGLYARQPGPFSPLVERDHHPKYTFLDGVTERPMWPSSG